LMAGSFNGLAAASNASVFLEELTWTSLRERVNAGATTALVPIGGTEQNGPHMVLGKHNTRVRWLAGRIAQQLGDAIVAPVLAYVPEGQVSPPTQHMRYAGTLSIPEPVFEATLAATARSLRQHGFCNVVLLGDHGGYRASLERAAVLVNKEAGVKAGCRVLPLPEYYSASSSGFNAILKARGFSAEEIGSHAGLADTSLALAADPALVRQDLVTMAGKHNDGVTGDPRRASAELGRLGAEHIVQSTVAAVRAQTAAAK
jgi:creatinine amidohydrolase